jgi:N6-L-threonylcarbamoyladenine synthase
MHRMPEPDTLPTILALETSCDETAVALLDGREGRTLARLASQIPLHQPYGGVVPELASRNHLTMLRPLLTDLLAEAKIPIDGIDAFAATSGPGLASSLMIGLSAAKGLALATGKPFIAVNHLEGHLLSPFYPEEGRGNFAEAAVEPCVALVVSGGHTLLVEIRAFGDYRQLGRTRDDAAGEAFDKVAKLLGLPYPGGPEIDKLAKLGNPAAVDFPRSMLDSGDLDFSFSGLKTSVRHDLARLRALPIADVCASFQEAVVEVLVAKTIAAARRARHRLVTVSGGVSCNSRLRALMAERTAAAGLELRLCPPRLSTDNAAMIAFAAALHCRAGASSPLTQEINPNLPLTMAA